MIQHWIVEREERNQVEALLSVVSFRYAWQYPDKPVSSRTLETQAGAYWPLFPPCCGIHGIRQEKGVIEAFSP